jgi:hypothetical protein
MISRITFILLAAFWLTMTYLLWRNEYVGHDQAGGNTSVYVVWKKILTSQESSRLDIFHNGVRLGNCTWSTTIGQQPSKSQGSSEAPTPEGMVRHPSFYRINFEGSAIFDGGVGRLRCDCEIKLSTSNSWEEVQAQVKTKQGRWQMRSEAAEQSVHLMVGDEREARFEQVLRFSDLENPQNLLENFDISMPLGLLGALAPLAHSPASSRQLSLGLQWTARNDWINIGHSSVRAYRLEAVALERYHMIVVVSPTGEILEVQLPDGWHLVNDQLSM